MHKNVNNGKFMLQTVLSSGIGRALRLVMPVEFTDIIVSNEAPAISSDMVD